uniref:Bm3820 n=1 Tax=Loa loa TaxID=7209 RepID=A0A1I7VMT7_LOALO
MIMVIKYIKCKMYNLNYCSNTKRAVVNVVGLGEMDSRQVSLATTNRHSLYASKPRAAEKHCLEEEAASFEQTSEDIEISETILLARQDRKLRGERMDFTRRWLTGDIKSWVAVQPKPDLILGGVEEEHDIDERSLGSCSAEVAAINSVVRKKKKARDVPDLIQNVASKGSYVRHSNARQMDQGSTRQYLQQTDPIKPLPIKVQATFNFPTGSISNLNNSGSFSQSFHDSKVWASNYDINSNQIPLQRVPSHNRIVEQRHHDFGAILWRPGSQDQRHNTLRSARSEEVQISTRKMGAFTPLQPPSIVTMRGSVASLPNSSNIRSRLLHNADPIATIDALVAELELNTDQTPVACKRRSFPIGNDFFVRNSGNYEKPVSSQQVEHNNICSSVKTKSEYNTGRKQQPQKLKDSFNEMANMLQNVISDVTATSELSKGRKYVQMGVKSSSVLSPFETINQEKLNPSKVEAMQSIFENKQHAAVSRRSIPSGNNNSVMSASNAKDDDNYYEINDFIVPRKEFFPSYAKPFGKQSSSTVRPAFQSKRRLPSATASRSEFIPAFPVTHPPPRPPGSTNSSQTGGYYSGSSLGAQSSYASPNNHLSTPHPSGNRGPLLGKQSVSSWTASLDEEDDGFYDNIQTDEKRFSHGSELGSVSTAGHSILSTTPKLPGPVKASSRIGQFLRKIGSSKPPVTAASLISLNKIANEIMPIKPIPLMKSNSLSHCQEKKDVVQNTDTTASSALVDKRGGLGQRLKNSIFGSKKRLN